MANIKTTEKEWERAREYFEAGVKPSEIYRKMGISESRLSKKIKSDRWSKESQKKALIQAAVSVEVAKSSLSKVALQIHDEIVDEKAHYLKFFNNAAMVNVEEAMAHGCDSQQDYRHRAETIQKGRDGVMGKSPDTAIQINTNGNPLPQPLPLDPVDASRAYLDFITQ
jgi:hypothetical protein